MRIKSPFALLTVTKLVAVVPLLCTQACSDGADPPGSTPARGGASTQPNPSRSGSGGTTALGGATSSGGTAVAGQGQSPGGGASSGGTNGGAGGETQSAGGTAGAPSAGTAGSPSGGTAGTPSGGTAGAPSAGTAGAPSAGAAGSTSGGGAMKPSGVIRITDPVPGWASVDGGTTGGGTDLGSAITVKTSGELNSAASSSGKKIILVEPGTYSSLSPASDKTIIGKAPGVIIKGRLNITGKSNIIIRNIAVQDNRCGSFEACRSGSDAVYIGNGSHHVWLDHMDISDGQDGNLDQTNKADTTTITWSKFHYTYDKPHAFSNLIAGSDSDSGAYRITYANCWWGKGVEQRQPRGRFGDVHVFNSYYNTDSNKPADTYLLGPGKDMSMLIENNFFDVSPSVPAIKEWGTPRGYQAKGNAGTAMGLEAQKGQVFTPPYMYDLIPASQVKEVVTAMEGGAGNTVRFEQ